MRSTAVLLTFLLCQWSSLAHEEHEGTKKHRRALLVEEDLQIEPNVKTSYDEDSRQTDVCTDIWAELKDLRELTIEMKAEIKMLKEENLVLKTRIDLSEAQVEALRQTNANLENKVDINKSGMEDLRSKNIALEVSMISNKKAVEKIRTETARQLKVAFSATLSQTGGFGPFSEEVTLKFSEIFTNFGQAYDPTTGIFTAPVSGIYYFRLTVLELRDNSWAGVYLYHNSKLILGAFEYSDGKHESASNAAVLQLEQGDAVFLNLPKGHGLYNDGNNYCIFSGFLLFPL